MPTAKLANTAGIARSVGPLRKPAFMRCALLPSLKRITPTAPAVWAFASFCTNGHVPRWISETAPLVAAGKSAASQPLLLVSVDGLAMTMSFVGTTRAFGTSAVGENSNVM